MRKGQRVQIISGALKGENATVCANPESSVHDDGEYVWIKFDRDNAQVKIRPGAYAVLKQQWYDKRSLKKI